MATATLIFHFLSKISINNRFKSKSFIFLRLPPRWQFYIYQKLFLNDCSERKSIIFGGYRHVDRFLFIQNFPEMTAQKDKDSFLVATATLESFFSNRAMWKSKFLKKRYYFLRLPPRWQVFMFRKLYINNRFESKSIIFCGCRHVDRYKWFQIFWK